MDRDAGAGQEPVDELVGAAVTLARSFAAGATMWCAAPEWPAHARHVAVEFVHPVIVGTRALPAVSVDGPDPVGTVRSLARPGDVLLAVSSAGDGRTGRLLAHAEAWGLVRLWLGAGPRPPSGRAEHVVWLEEADPAVAARSGDLVMAYHLLWELTHVVFVHPGMLQAPASAADCTEEVCITCSDEGRVGEVTLVGEGGAAEVVIGGRPETVDVSLVERVDKGALVLVHAGVAIGNLDVEPGFPG